MNDLERVNPTVTPSAAAILSQVLMKESDKDGTPKTFRQNNDA